MPPSTFSLPAEFTSAFLDGQIIDAGVAELHVAEVVKLPVLVAVGAITLTGVIVIFILKMHGDAIVPECPQIFLQTVVQLAIPFTPEKFLDLRAAVDELGAVAPFGVLGVGERDALGVVGIPSVLGGLDFLARGFFSVRRQRWTRIHLIILESTVSGCSERFQNYVLRLHLAQRRRRLAVPENNQRRDGVMPKRAASSGTSSMFTLTCKPEADRQSRSRVFRYDTSLLPFGKTR